MRINLKNFKVLRWNKLQLITHVMLIIITLRLLIASFFTVSNLRLINLFLPLIHLFILDCSWRSNLRRKSAITRCSRHRRRAAICWNLRGNFGIRLQLGQSNSSGRFSRTRIISIKAFTVRSPLALSIKLGCLVFYWQVSKQAQLPY